MHLDGVENEYEFVSTERLWDDFLFHIKKLGGSL